MKMRTPNPKDRDLVRLLSGELPAAAAEQLKRRLGEEPELAQAWERLSGSWAGLELPPPTPVPAGYAHRLTVRATTQIALAPLAARRRWFFAGAVASLLSGLLLGAGLDAWRRHLGRASPEAQDWYVVAGAETDWAALAEESGDGR